MTGTYFEDLEIDQRLNCHPVRITQQQIVSFARQFDPLPFHIDEEAASRSVFNGLVASSLYTNSACTKTVVEALGGLVILSGQGIEITRTYHQPSSVVSKTEFDEGYLVLVQLQVKVPEDSFYIMIEDPPPGGLAALNENLNITSHDSVIASQPGYSSEDLFRYQDYG